MTRLLLAFAVLLLAAPQPEATVRIGDQSLFAIQAPLGPFSAADRTRAATRRLNALIRDYSISPASLSLATEPDNTDILAGDDILLTITDADAAAAGTTRDALAHQDLRLIQQGLAHVRAEYSHRSLWTGVGLAALSTIVLFVILLALRKLTPRLNQFIESHRAAVRPLRLQSLEILSADRIVEGLVRFIALLRLAVVLVLLYFYIPLVFSFFPQTRSLGNRILGYVFDPIRHGWTAFLAYLPDLLVVLVIVVFAFLAVRINHFLFRQIERGTISWSGFYREWAAPTSRILDILIIAFSLVVMFPYLPGSDSPAFKGVSIFLGVLFSLGSTSAVSNLIGGIILTYTRAFHVGDRVQVDDTVGDVIEKGFLATKIRTIKNVDVTVPNSLVLSSHIINFSAAPADRPLILHTSVTIGYDSPWRQIHELLTQAALSTPGLLKDPAPFVLQTALDDFYVAYQINAYTADAHTMAATYSQLHANIQDKFNEAGVEIMSPHYGAVRDGNTIAIPEDYRPRDYKAPSFRLSSLFNPGEK